MPVRSLWTGLLLVALTSCSKYMDGYSCLNPDRGHKDARNEPDPCHYHDPDAGADAGTDAQCEVGEYLHWEVGWDEPSWLWIGAEDLAPECPAGLATTAYEGHADLVAPAVCEACTCEPPTGSCTLPSKLMASTATCGVPGVTTSFDAPATWDGSCDGTTQTPDGAAHSLSIDPITMSENGCASGPPAAAKIVSLRWDTFARACDVVGWSAGPTRRSACVPDEPLPSGFHLCIYRESERACPTEPGNVFTERHTFYKGVDDDRQCSTCTCGVPTGSTCTAEVSIYKGNDLTCSGPTVAKGITISSSSPTCIDIQLPGQALGSKSAGPTTYIPGTCPPLGGDASGSASPTDPDTFCCRP
jgi:hypothetical protein